MKADIQSQIRQIDNIMSVTSYIVFPKIVEELRARERFLIHVLNAPVSEIDQRAIKFVYGE